MKLFRTKLKFSGNLEEQFQEDYYIKSIGTARIALILGVILYSTFGILDIYLAPLSTKKIWIIRFGIVVPVLFLVLGISFFSFFKKVMQITISLTALIAGLGISAMIAVITEKTGGLYYYAGLLLVIMWTYTFVKLRFIYAAITCWIIVVSYEFVAIVIQELTQSPELISIFLNNNFFFIGANIIGMFACYLIELYTRKDFLQRLEIATNREELKTEKNELQTRIDIMNEELEMARLIQQRLIPKEHPNDNIYSLYKPMEAVGGDLLDFINIKRDNQIGIFLSDVSGHGVPAALITSMIKSSILESRKYDIDPAKMLAHLNQLLTLHQLEETFVTAFYCIYDPNKRTLYYSNAGHHPPSIITKHKVIRIDSAKSIPLAIMENKDMIEAGLGYKNVKISLPKNSKLVIYTDGLVESKSLLENNTTSKDFGENLDSCFLRLQPLKCRDFVNELYDELVRFRGNDSFDDDICIVCLDII